MPVLNKCDLFMLPSRYEGLGLVLLEADTLSIPVFATDIDGPRGFMKEHGGLLVPDDIEGILSGMNMFVNGKIKPMNAVNNGPVYTDNDDQNLTNLPDFREANIPFARTHDSSICYDYGGEHTVDIHNIFTDFDADPYSPESYDFTLTDIYLGTIMRAGAKVFYRLGSKIEHWPKHYGVMPPKDYEKWAVVCEHIIMHMNEGWANGFHMGIEYWEIWNEPDLNQKLSLIHI